VIRVKGITHRKNPIWHTIIPGREVHNAVALMAEASIYRSISTQVPGKDIILIPEARSHELNPVTDRGLICKIGFDATAPCPRPEEFERFKVREVDMENYDIEQ
jgi:3-polyprenyl-4-hydroxybenzoate decarboxylase